MPTNRSAIAFARGARTGVLIILIPSAGEDGIEGSGELRVSVAEEELDGVRLLGELTQMLRACWVTQSLTG